MFASPLNGCLRLVLFFLLVTLTAARLHLKPTEKLQTGAGAVKEPLEIAIDRLKRLVDDGSQEEAEEINEMDVEEEFRFNPSIKEAQERVAGMRDYLLSIANTPFSEELPPPHLERHQAYLLFGGFLYSFKKLETMLLGTECFPFPVIDKILHFVHDLFTKPSIKRQTGSKIKFEPLIKETSFMDYDLPKTIPGHISYVSHVLWHEAITKLVMDLQGCDYLEATGIALGEEEPTRTPYGLKWESLVEEAKRRNTNPTTSKRKQATPRRVFRKK